MGRDKADLMTPSGTSFLDLACQRLTKHCDLVCVSASQVRKAGYQQITDPPDSHGPISGIHASLAFADQHGFDACVFSPVDTPYLSHGNLKTLIDAFCEHPDNIVCAIPDDMTSRVEPLIAVYPIESATAIRDSIDRRQYSLQRLLETLSVVRVPLSADACRNINTPSDLDDLPNQP